jgi:hypothetical protein
MADPRAMGLALLQQYAPAIPMPKPSAFGPFQQAADMGRQLAKGSAADWSPDRQRYQTPSAIIPGSDAAALAAARAYGPVIIDPNNPYAGSQWDPNYGR